jgi:hypothetical protein
MTNFEYKTGFNLSDRELNEYGSEGWELVSVAGMVNDVGGGMHYVFKRPVMPEQPNSEWRVSERQIR